MVSLGSWQLSEVTGEEVTSVSSVSMGSWQAALVIGEEREEVSSVSIGSWQQVAEQEVPPMPSWDVVPSHSLPTGELVGELGVLVGRSSLDDPPLYQYGEHIVASAPAGQPGQQASMQTEDWPSSVSEASTVLVPRCAAAAQEPLGRRQLGQLAPGIMADIEGAGQLRQLGQSGQQHDDAMSDTTIGIDLDLAGDGRFGQPGQPFIYPVAPPAAPPASRLNSKGRTKGSLGMPTGDVLFGGGPLFPGNTLPTVEEQVEYNPWTAWSAPEPDQPGPLSRPGSCSWAAWPASCPSSVGRARLGWMPPGCGRNALALQGHRRLRRVQADRR